MHRIIGIDDIMHIIHRHIRTLNTVSIERSVLCVYVCLVHMHIESYVRIKKNKSANRNRTEQIPCTMHNTHEAFACPLIITSAQQHFVLYYIVLIRIYVSNKI